MAGNWNSGRRPKPTRLQVLRGKKTERPDEPQPPRAPESFDAPPDELIGDPEALKEWQRIVPMLRVTGIITSAERSALIALCCEWSRWVEAQRNIRRLGMLVKGKHDLPMRNPYIRIATDSMKACVRLWTELGLTPSSRSKLSMLPSLPIPKASRWGTDL